MNSRSCLPFGRRFVSSLAVFIVALAGCPAVRADTLTATFNSVSPSHNITFTLNGVSPALTQTTPGGVFNWTAISGPISGNFTTFCIELTQFINFGHTYTFNVVSPQNAGNPDTGIFGIGTIGPMGAGRADLLSELFGRHYAQVVDANTAAAFQMAVWEVVYDGDKSNANHFNLDITKGNLTESSGSSTIDSTATSWLNSLDGTGPRMTLTGLTSLLPDGTNDGAQDQITPSSPTPEPSTLVLAALCALCQGAFLAYRGLKK